MTDYAERQLEALRAAARPLDSLTVGGVYFIFDAAGELTYIGQSISVAQRVLSHRDKGTSYAFIPTDEPDEWEAFFINLYRPPCNRDIPRPPTASPAALLVAAPPVQPLEAAGELLEESGEEHSKTSDSSEPGVHCEAQLGGGTSGPAPPKERESPVETRWNPLILECERRATDVVGQVAAAFRLHGTVPPELAQECCRLYETMHLALASYFQEVPPSAADAAIESAEAGEINEWTLAYCYDGALADALEGQART